MKTLLISAMIAVASLGASAQTQCKAPTKANKQCSRKAVDNGYCRQHNPNAVKCAAKNKAGNPCGLMPSKGGKFCHIHKNNISKYPL